MRIFSPALISILRDFPLQAFHQAHKHTSENKNQQIIYYYGRRDERKSIKTRFYFIFVIAKRRKKYRKCLK